MHALKYLVWQCSWRTGGYYPDVKRADETFAKFMNETRLMVTSPSGICRSEYKYDGPLSFGFRINIAATHGLRIATISQRRDLFGYQTDEEHDDRSTPEQRASVGEPAKHDECPGVI